MGAATTAPHSAHTAHTGQILSRCPPGGTNESGAVTALLGRAPLSLGAIAPVARLAGQWLGIRGRWASPPAALAEVIAARSSLLILASPLGTALGGPIVAALGARGTLLASALATITLGLMTAAVLARTRSATRKPATSG